MHTLKFRFLEISIGTYFLLYLTLNFSNIILIFSNNGLITDPKLSYLYNLHFPNMLDYFNSPLQIFFFISALALCSICIIIGKLKSWPRFLLWYGIACLIHRNPFILNPPLPFLQWILLVLVVSKNRLSTSFEKWGIVIIALAYSLSGIAKLFSPSWIHGDALSYIFKSICFKNNYLTYLYSLFSINIQKFITYLVLAIEILYLPAIFFKKTKSIFWWLITIMHLILLLIFRSTEVPLGMLVVQMFTIDHKLFLKLYLKIRYYLKFIFTFSDSF